MRLSVQAVFLRLFITLLVLLGFSFFLPSFHHASAQEEISVPSYKAPNVNPDVPLNQHTYMQTMFIELGSTIICQLAGIDIINPQQGCLGIDPQTKKIGFVKPQTLPDGTPMAGGAIGAMSTMVSSLYMPPTSSATYVKHLANNFYLVKQTYAQRVAPARTGYDGLQPLVFIWKTIRNIAYALLVVVFSLVGLGIMLRVKIDPRTVMSLQNQIPKMVIAIILITFSFAIVGLLIDFMWVGTYYGINLLSDSVASSGLDNDIKTAETIQSEATRNIINNPLSFTAHIFSGDGEFWGLAQMANDIGQNVGRVISGVVTISLFNAGSVIQDCSFADYLSNLNDLGNCLQGEIFTLIGWLVGIIGVIIVLVTLFIVLLKLWIALLKAYIWILFDVITAPFWILAGLNPFGTSLGFKHWVQHVIAHLTVFPAAAFMIIIAKIFQVTFNPPNVMNLEIAPTSTAQTFFVAPLVGNGQIFGFLGELVAFGILLITPDLLNILRDTLKQPGSKYAGNLRSRFMAGSPTNIMGPLGNFGYQIQYMKNVPVVGSVWGKFAGKGERQKAETGTDLHAKS